MSVRLVKYNKEKQILKKNVSAIHISAKLSLLQRKLVNALLYNAYDQLLTAKEHQISSTLLSEIIGFDSHNTAYLKAALKGLVETTIEFDILEDDGTRDWKVSSLISEAGIRNGVCSYAFSATMAEKLYHPDMYSKINLSVLREMKSAHALVLYENCHRYLGIAHTPWWDVDVFRKLMSVDQMTSYKQFKLLNRAVIQPAVKEVNELSNVQIELETKRKGRSVTGLRFLIRPNPQLSLIGMDTEDAVTETAAYKLDFVQNRPRPHVHVQKISYVAISSRACSRGKMIPPKSPPSRYWLLHRMRDCGSRCSLNSSRLMT